VVIDTLDRTARYSALHPLFARAFEFLATVDLGTLTPGRIPLLGDRLFVLIDHVEGRGLERARLECHRRYIDIQVTVAGTEHIGWRPLASCSMPDGTFAEDRDIGFFSDRPDTWLAVPQNHFVIFFPDDVHAPLGGEGPLKKAVVKVEL
jgi:biofilm protein TabA